jgi:hypothetical protein
MLLYHFTCREHLESIMREVLNRGDVPLRLRAPYGETSAVWLTDIPHPDGCGLGEARVLTEADRRGYFETFGVMPPENKRIPDKKAVRITVLISSKDRRLKRWQSYGRKHCEPAFMIRWCALTGATTNIGGSILARLRQSSFEQSTT